MRDEWAPKVLEVVECAVELCLVFNVNVLFAGELCAVVVCTGELRAADVGGLRNGAVNRRKWTAMVENVCRGRCTHSLGRHGVVIVSWRRAL